MPHWFNPSALSCLKDATAIVENNCHVILNEVAVGGTWQNTFYTDVKIQCLLTESCPNHYSIDELVYPWCMLVWLLLQDNNVHASCHWLYSEERETCQTEWLSSLIQNPVFMLAYSLKMFFFFWWLMEVSIGTITSLQSCNPIHNNKCVVMHSFILIKAINHFCHNSSSVGSYLVWKLLFISWIDRFWPSNVLLAVGNFHFLDHCQ